MSEIPPSVYVIIGTLIITNIGTVITVFVGVGKLIWWLSSLNSRVAGLEKKTDDNGPIARDINEAHKAIRSLKIKGV